MIDAGVSACSIQCWVEVGTSPRSVVVLVPSRWSLPPGVLVVLCAFIVNQGTSTSSSSVPSNLRVINVFLPRHASASFSSGSSVAFNNLLRILSEFIYLLVPVLIISNDRQPPHCLVPHHFTHNTRPTSLQPLYTHYIHNYNRIIPKYAVQNNPSCCI